MGKPPLSIGQIAPTPGLVQQFFNGSTGLGQEGEMDVRDAWNQGGDWQYVESPVITSQNGSESSDGLLAERNDPVDNEILRELFVEQLQDLHDAENQIVEALPQMIAKAETPSLKASLEIHLQETKEQVSRLSQIFEMLSVSPKYRTCKGMEGLLQEGQEVMQRSKDKESVARDLALITAAQKVEHYEISAYCSARTMAQQLGQPEIAQLLSKSLAEEENADSMLNTCARPLMSEAKLVEA
jgi:Mn-containing catalase